MRTHIELAEQRVELESNLEYMKTAQRRMIETEKMTSIGILMAGVAHEINNPINYIINSLDGYRADFEEVKKLLDVVLSAEDFTSEEFQVSLEHIFKDADYSLLKEEMEKLLEKVYSGAVKVHEIVKALRAFSTSEIEEKQTVDIEPEVERAVLMISHKLERGVELERKRKTGARVKAQPGRLSQVFLQLLENALEAIEKKRGEGERITLAIEKDPDREGYLLVRVGDTGCGMTEEELERAAEPFYTNKEIGRGTGLGLTTVQHIVRDLYGHVEIDSRLNEGTEVRVILPAESL